MPYPDIFQEVIAEVVDGKIAAIVFFAAMGAADIYVVELICAGFKVKRKRTLRDVVTQAAVILREDVDVWAVRPLIDND